MTYSDSKILDNRLRRLLPGRTVMVSSEGFGCWTVMVGGVVVGRVGYNDTIDTAVASVAAAVLRKNNNNDE